MTPSVAQSSESLAPSPETKPEEAPVKAKTEQAKKDEVAASPVIPAPEAKVEAPPAAVTPPEPPKRPLQNLNKFQQRLRRKKNQHNLLRLRQYHKRISPDIREHGFLLTLKMPTSTTS